MCGERGGKQGRQGGHRAVHQTRQAGLDDLEHEQPFLSVGFLFTELGQRDPLRNLGVVTFLLGQISQQLAHARVRRPARRRLVEPFGFEFHELGLLLHRFQSKRPDQPDRPAAHKSAHILPSQQWHVLAETAPVKIEEPMAVRVFVAPEF